MGWIINETKEIFYMEKIYHPVSGESGFFCSEKEKILVDAILVDYSNQLVVTDASLSQRGVENE